MIVVAILVGLMIIGLMVLVEFINTRGSGDMSCGLHFGLLISILFVIEVSILSDIIGEPKPTPMDVYQGKTTLEYTIRDSIKIDSIVVFKNSVYGEED